MPRPSMRLTRRTGAATLEFAVTAPFIFLMVLASIQFAGLLMSQNVLTAAAREGGRVASLPSTVSDDTVIQAVQDRLSRGGLDPSRIDIDVSTSVAWSDLDSGDEVSVRLAGAMSDLAWIAYVNILPDTNLTAEITYERE